MNPSQETVALSELETHHAELVARVADSQATVSAAAEVIRLRSDDSQRGTPGFPLKLAAPVQPTLRRLSSFDNFRFRGHQRF